MLVLNIVANSDFMDTVYNSQNLSLSPLKVIKKIVAGIIPLTIFLIFAGVFLQIGTPIAGDLTRSASLFLATLIIIWILVLLTNSIYQYFYYRLYYYDFKVDKAEIRKGVITQATGHVFYKRLQNIYVDQDWLDRLFGLYDIHF